ncbi:MAG TPA: prepilin-type N-terminal cleavage/methylation domain-containing protein [Anaerohalosphaeraceae bacterium]|nr:prepilin-type N-terminal cleavage/methylation domain-containing protein [Anaerohalosphaeraceae bacterium]
MPAIPHHSARIRSGFSLIELLIAIAIIAIPLAAIAALLAGTSRSWQRLYNDTHSQIRQDSLALMTSIQKIGRQSNLTNYTIYTIKNNTFTPAAPPSGQSIASGQAVEFRFWQDEFDPQKPADTVFEDDNTGTHYALYYLDGSALKLDIGRVVNGVGAVANKTRQTAAILNSQVLTQQVDTAANSKLFSHVMSGGQGSGCVNTKIILTDKNKDSIEILFGTLLRSAWPR